MFDLCIGDQVVNVLRGAKKEVVVVAPFIKVSALKRIIDCINVEKVKVDCVTRWLPQDIAAGVCDIEIYDLLKRVPDANLWMNKRLHAKYVRADRKCLTGSANLTESALGWRTPSNLELMVDVSSVIQDMRDWEARLFDCSTVVNKKTRDEIQSSSASLVKEGRHMQYVEFHVDDNVSDHWLPQYASPNKLYRVYSGELTIENISKSSLMYAMSDLNVLGIPTGLSEEDFNAAVASQICTSSVIMEVLRASEKSRGAGLSVADVERIVMTFMEDVNVRGSSGVGARVVEWIDHFLVEYRAESEVVRLVRAIEV